MKMDTEGLANLVRHAFAPIMGADEIDVWINEVGNTLEIGDEVWRLRVEGWPDRTLATVSIAREIDPADAPRARREAAMAYEIDEALAHIDARVDGRLSTALTNSDDPVSRDLADAIHEHQERFVRS